MKSYSSWIVAASSALTVAEESKSANVDRVGKRILDYLADVARKSIDGGSALIYTSSYQGKNICLIIAMLPPCGGNSQQSRPAIAIRGGRQNLTPLPETWENDRSCASKIHLAPDLHLSHGVPAFTETRV